MQALDRGFSPSGVQKALVSGTPNSQNLQKTITTKYNKTLRESEGTFGLSGMTSLKSSSEVIVPKSN